MHTSKDNQRIKIQTLFPGDLLTQDKSDLTLRVLAKHGQDARLHRGCIAMIRSGSDGWDGRLRV